jgi:glycosyltransferase involved in cell wall biosynthesis
MKIDLIFIAYNRLPYTKLAIPALLADPTEEFLLTIWDNGSTDGTREYLASVEDPRIVRTVFSAENVKLNGAVNDVVDRSEADLFGIVFDDDLVTPGWTRPLAQAHADVPDFGMIGCWHFSPETFDYERAKHKIQRFGQHQVLRHPWTGVGAGLAKVKTMRECGPLESSRTTGYWIKMALKGYVNGYYYPLIYVEHMDYPWSQHFTFSDKLDKWFETSSGPKHLRIRSVEEAKAWNQVIVRNLFDDPWDPKYYVGWRAKLRRAISMLSKMFNRCVGTE